MDLVAHDRYTERLDIAARLACTAYLDGVAAYGAHRHWQEYDNLDDNGKAVWRAVVTRAVYHMLPVIKAFGDAAASPAAREGE